MASRSEHSESDEKIVHDPYKGTSIWTSASLLLWLNLKLSAQFDIEVIKLKQKTLPYITEKERNGDETFEKSGKYICVGSTAEGTTINDVSDTDLMFCLKGCVCYDIKSRDVVDFKDEQYKLIADRRFASNGYTLLWNVNEYVATMATVKKIFWKPPDIVSNRVKSNVFVCSKKKRKAVQFRNVIVDHFIIDYLQYNNPILQIHGPALSFSLQIQIKNRALVKQCLGETDKEITVTENIDKVIAIEFISRDIEQRWVKRIRRNDWPSKHLIHEVSNLPGHVVCTGRKGSKFERYEWRISYTLAECKLVCSLNEVQIVMYMYLKDLFGEQFKSFFPDCTSYIIKNIILWLSETVHPSYFRRENFLPLVLSTITVLSWCIEKKCLPSYMIPERNLFERKFDDTHFRQRIISRLKWLIVSRAIFEFKTKDISMLGLYKQIRTGDKAAIIEQHQKKVMIWKTIFFLITCIVKRKPLHRFLLVFALRLVGCTACVKSVLNKYVS